MAAGLEVIFAGGGAGVAAASCAAAGADLSGFAAMTGFFFARFFAGDGRVGGSSFDFASAAIGDCSLACNVMSPRDVT